MKKVAQGNESMSEIFLQKWRWKNMTMKSALQHEPVGNNTEKKGGESVLENQKYFSFLSLDSCTRLQLRELVCTHNFV